MSSLPPQKMKLVWGCMSPSTAMVIQQTAMGDGGAIIPPFIDYLESICFYLIIDIIHKH